MQKQIMQKAKTRKTKTTDFSCDIYKSHPCDIDFT